MVVDGRLKKEERGKKKEERDKLLRVAGWELGVGSWEIEERGKMLRVFCVVLDTFFVPLLCTKNTRTDGWLTLEIVFVELFMVMD